MERDQCVARDFLGLAATSGAADSKGRNSKDAANITRGGSGDGGDTVMHGSGKPQGGVHRPVPFSDAAAAANGAGGDGSPAARLRQMSDPSGLNPTSAFNNGAGAFRGPVFTSSLASSPGINMKGSSAPGLTGMPDYQQGQWTALEKVQSLTSALAQAHPNFAFDRSSLKELKQRGNYVAREDIAHGNYDIAQLAMAASQAQFAAVSRRLAVQNSPIPNQGVRPIDDKNTMARPGDLPGMLESRLSLSMAGPREHPLPVPSFRVPPVAAATGANGTIQGAMAAPRAPVTIVGNGPLPNGVLRGPSATNSSGRPATAQLTIFYAGSVNVYDDVTAEKAEAIMLLAGSGSSWSTRIINAPPAPQSLPNVAGTPGTQVSKMEMSVSSASVPVSPQMTAPRVQALTPASQSALQQPASGSSGSNQASLASAVSAATNQHEAAAAAVVVSATSAAASSPSLGCNPGGELPHARRRSLARFLEKRRVRGATVRQKNAYTEKQEGSPTRPKIPSPPRSIAGSPQRPPDRANSPPAPSQGEDLQQNISKTTKQVDEMERVEERESWPKASSAEQKRSPQDMTSSPIKAS